jgi:hypothetical protein
MYTYNYLTVMFISQTGLTYFYKWPVTCEIQILNIIECGSGLCNRCDQKLSVLASRFFASQRACGTMVKYILILAKIVCL